MCITHKTSGNENLQLAGYRLQSCSRCVKSCYNPIGAIGAPGNTAPPILAGATNARHSPQLEQHYPRLGRVKRHGITVNIQSRSISQSRLYMDVVLQLFCSSAILITSRPSQQTVSICPHQHDGLERVHRQPFIDPCGSRSGCEKPHIAY